MSIIQDIQRTLGEIFGTTPKSKRRRKKRIGKRSYRTRSRAKRRYRRR